MKRHPLSSYIVLAVVVLLTLTIPTLTIEPVKKGLRTTLSPLFTLGYTIQSYCNLPFQSFFQKYIIDLEGNHKDPYEEALRLSAENVQLKEKIQRLENLLEHECALNKQLAGSPQRARENPNLRNGALQPRTQAIASRVICREPCNWNSTLWIDVGSQNNPPQAPPTICINSPVLLGDSLIGVIDSLGKRQSRVRLITDPSIRPSVRVSRDKQLFLAKGELRGNGDALWRRGGTILTGIGFNYDQEDEWGPARDLRTGISSQEELSSQPLLLISPGDLLITTGMDGVFPPGLPVARVSTVYPLKEGSYGYDIEALPTAGDIRSLHTVFVIPPTKNEIAG